MAKKSSKKNLKINKLWFVVAALFALQIVTIWYLLEFRVGYDRVERSNFQQMLNAWEERRYSDPIISMSERKVYLPEARMYMPFNDTSRDVRYFLQNKPDGSGAEEIALGLPASIGHQNDVDDPACDRMVILTVHDKYNGDDYVSAGSLKSPDGDMWHVFRYDGKCSIYTEESMDDLVKTVKAIKFY